MTDKATVRRREVGRRGPRAGASRALGLWSRAFLCVSALLLVFGCASKKDFGTLGTPEKWREAMQPPLAADAATSLTESVRLRVILPLALARNPGVQAARLRWLAAIHVEPQASSLDDPMVEFGYEFDSVESLFEPRPWTVGASQTLPWWSKLWARGRAAATEADVARLRYEAAARDLLIDVKDSYYELYYIDHAIEVTTGVERLLRQEALAGHAELDGGDVSLGETFQAESRAAQLAYDRALLTEQRAAQAERLRSLLSLPAETALGRVETAPVYAVDDDLDSLQARAERFSETLRIKGLDIQKAEYDAYLAKLSRIPDVSVGGAYTGPPGARGDRDPYMASFSANLPIWEQRNRALIREKRALEDAMKQEALDAANATRAAVAAAWFQARLTRRLEILYNETLIPQARSAMGRVELDFRAGLSPFGSVIETTLAYHNFVLAGYRARADRGQAIGRLEMVLGTTAEPRVDESPRNEKGERP